MQYDAFLFLTKHRFKFQSPNGENGNAIIYCFLTYNEYAEEFQSPNGENGNAIVRIPSFWGNCRLRFSPLTGKMVMQFV